jgi:hypothetical protein
VGATIYFADEAGVRSDDHAGTTWAPVGHTPVVTSTGDRFGVNLISAVTAKGKLRFAVYDGNLNGKAFIEFCRRLLADTPGPVFLVLDGHPVHRSKAVKAVAASTNGRLRLCFLPGDAPELNPDEWGRSTSSTTESAVLVSAARRISKPRRWPRCTGCRSSRTWCAASSGIPTCGTSPPEQSTYLLSPW